MGACEAGIRHPAAVLWDLDGTLVDSGPFHWLAWRETMAAEGRTFTRYEFETTFGQRNDRILRALFGSALAPSELDRIGNEKEERYRRLVGSGGLAFLPGVVTWLKALKREGWSQAIVSSAPRLNVSTVLDGLDAHSYFDAVIAAEDVTHGKPDPEVFLGAAARLGIDPERCVVVEDALAGIEGARCAGMRSVYVGEPGCHVDADVSTRSLEDLPGDAFARLVSGRSPDRLRTAHVSCSG